MGKRIFYCIIVLSLFIFVGCEEKGALEKAGERADEVVDNVKDGDPVLHKKGPLEKTGEAVDDTMKDVKREIDDTADDVEDKVEKKRD